MAASRLPNYLRTHRKRLGLSQAEIAFLLGTENGAKVCRHERFARTPSLETVLAYEVILQRPARELFAGLYQRIEGDIARRAKMLLVRKNRPGRQSERLHEVLASIANPSSKKS